ncbi:MAG: serine--tRNA ligase, partial [Thermodesulfobacteriota bacterium]
MLDPKFIRQHPERVAQALADRGAEVSLEEFDDLDVVRRSLLTESEELKHRRNQLTQEVGRRKKAGQDSESLQEEVRGIGQRIKDLDGELAKVDEALNSWLLSVPNVPHASTPRGRSAEDNPVIRTWGKPPRFDFEPQPHWDLGEALGVLDFERAAKIAGTRFALLKGPAARLERALIGFMLDLHTQEHGYLEVLPPFMVNSLAMTGTGQLPKFAEDLFKLQDWDYWLIPTA